MSRRTLNTQAPSSHRQFVAKSNKPLNRHHDTKVTLGSSRHACRHTQSCYSSDAYESHEKHHKNSMQTLRHCSSKISVSASRVVASENSSTSRYRSEHYSKEKNPKRNHATSSERKNHTTSRYDKYNEKSHRRSANLCRKTSHSRSLSPVHRDKLCTLENRRRPSRWSSDSPMTVDGAKQGETNHATPTIIGHRPSNDVCKDVTKTWIQAAPWMKKGDNKLPVVPKTELVTFSNSKTSPHFARVCPEQLAGTKLKGTDATVPESYTPWHSNTETKGMSDCIENGNCLLYSNDQKGINGTVTESVQLCSSALSSTIKLSNGCSFPAECESYDMPYSVESFLNAAMNQEEENLRRFRLIRFLHENIGSCGSTKSQTSSHSNPGDPLLEMSPPILSMSVQSPVSACYMPQLTRNSYTNMQLNSCLLPNSNPVLPESLANSCNSDGPIQGSVAKYAKTVGAFETKWQIIPNKEQEVTVPSQPSSLLIPNMCQSGLEVSKDMSLEKSLTSSGTDLAAPPGLSGMNSEELVKVNTVFVPVFFNPTVPPPAASASLASSAIVHPTAVLPTHSTGLCGMPISCKVPSLQITNSSALPKMSTVKLLPGQTDFGSAPVLLGSTGTLHSAGAPGPVPNTGMSSVLKYNDKNKLSGILGGAEATGPISYVGPGHTVPPPVTFTAPVVFNPSIPPPAKFSSQFVSASTSSNSNTVPMASFSSISQPTASLVNGQTSSLSMLYPCPTTITTSSPQGPVNRVATISSNKSDLHQTTASNQSALQTIANAEVKANKSLQPSCVSWYKCTTGTSTNVPLANQMSIHVPNVLRTPGVPASWNSTLPILDTSVAPPSLTTSYTSAL